MHIKQIASVNFIQNKECEFSPTVKARFPSLGNARCQVCSHDAVSGVFDCASNASRSARGVFSEQIEHLLCELFLTFIAWDEILCVPLTGRSNLLFETHVVSPRSNSPCSKSYLELCSSNRTL